MRVLKVREGEPSTSVAYGSWSDWRSRRGIDAAAPSAPLGSCFCANCWGAGRVFEAARNGEGLIPVACATCCGTGGVPSAGVRRA
jgi:hypothetical protein